MVLGSLPISSNATAGIIAYSCDPDGSIESLGLCDAIMTNVSVRTGSKVVQVSSGSSTNAFWRTHRDSVVAGIDFSQILGSDKKKVAYTLRVDDEDLRRVLKLGHDGR